MSLFGLLGIARDGTAAQSAALTTTGSNVANVATPGYTRRTALLQASVTGGVTYTGTVRNFDRFAYGHVVDEAGKASAAMARSGALSEIENTMAPTSNSIGDDATAMIKAFNALSGFPIDPSLRADALVKAENLANNIRGTRSQLMTTSQNMVAQSQDKVTDLNSQLQHIADLNQQIATAVGVGTDASSLRDQRDLAIRSVGESIGARGIEDKTGRVTLFAAGTVLVEGDHANPLSMDLDPQSGNMRFYVTGAVKTEITSRVDTGALGGLREARDVDLAKTVQNLDSYAYDVANAFNKVHTTGYGMDGGTGRPLFSISATQAGAGASITIDPSVVGHPERVAMAGSAGDLPGGNTVGLELANLGDTQAFGGATLPDRFAAMATDIGFRKNNADAEAQLRSDTLATAQSLSDGANGVSLDEEMVNLTQFQRAFEASSKVLRTADELLQNLMDSI